MPLADQRKGNRVRHYRVMWDQNAGQELYYHPPMSAERIAQAHFGFFQGRPVDAYVGAMGSNAGFTVGWPTDVKGAEFIVDRMQRGAPIVDFKLWRVAETLRLAFKAGIDPEEVKVQEAKRIGVDFWFRLAMNDWHHFASTGDESNLWSGDFFRDHPEYCIGDDGAAGWPKNLWKSLRFFQDYAHQEVRDLRRDLALEACERYDVDGFLCDFMRCPGYFKYGEEQAGMALMTDLIRQMRVGIDRIGDARGRPIGFAVRVPNNIAGSKRLGLDVDTWVSDGLVDILVPSCFFGQDMEEDVTEWVDLVDSTDTRVYPAIEEGYLPGYSDDKRWFVKPPIMTGLTVEMTRAIAARHLARGVSGLYAFNFFGTAPTYNYDNRDVLDDIGNPMRLEFKDKTYVVMRSHESFPNCLETERQIPAVLDSDPLVINIEVADDACSKRDRLSTCRLRLHLKHMTVYDEIEVTLNGDQLLCDPPMQPGGYCVSNEAFGVYNESGWFQYDLLDHLPRCGSNELTLRIVKRNERLADEFDITVEDVELEIRYEYPDGIWPGSPRPA